MDEQGQDVVDYATAENMYVVLNIHHDGTDNNSDYKGTYGDEKYSHGWHLTLHLMMRQYGVELRQSLQECGRRLQKDLKIMMSILYLNQ